ncbi:MAG: hypothetical protein U9N10_10870 [Bacillota bacterium]|nr:hypothetical protein [Bacillota bacterium]
MRNEIPFKARIITLADAYDAMTSERSYRKGMSSEKAIIEIQKNSGSQFDPELAKVFVQMIENNEDNNIKESSV